MKKGMSTKKSIAIFAPCMTAVIAIMLTLIILATTYAETISLFLYGRAQTVDPAALTSGTALCEDIVEEGVVLLKNEKDKNGNPALPLTKSEAESVNVFGWAAFDWMTVVFGSGYSNTEFQKVKLFPALEEAGIKYNQKLYDLYYNFYHDTSRVYSEQDYVEYRNGVAFGSENIFVLREPNKDAYTSDIRNSIVETSDVGLVVLGRTGSESKDLKLEQTKQNQNNKNTTTTKERHYLELSTEEEEMIQVAKDTCDKVIVILNTANTMEVGFIDDPEIDAALLVGITGLTGVNGLINVLKGEKEALVPERNEDGGVKYDENGEVVYKKDANGEPVKETVKVSPSGRTADTYAYNLFTAPSSVNSGYTDDTMIRYTGSSEKSFRSHIDYYENIYVGYKWYETADAEGFWASEYAKNTWDVTKYEEVVQYPFGYGLSYTDFEWTVTKVEVSGKEKTSGELNKDDKIKITVEVKNVGQYPGADVVELYYIPQYIKGGIEKAYINLGAFAKTGVIQPEGTDIVELEISVQSMASYDCYDSNNNGHTGYELDAGEYKLCLMKNAHEYGNMSDKAFNGAAAAVKDPVITYTIKETNYDTDEATGEKVENRFTNKDGSVDKNASEDTTIDKADLDGSLEENPVVYMTREGFVFPEKDVRKMSAEALAVAKTVIPTDEQLEQTGYGRDQINTPVTSQDAGLKLADMQATKGADGKYSFTGYEDNDWQTLIEQISYSELCSLINNGYFQTEAISSIGKERYVDLDGPMGFNTRVTGGNGSSCKFVAYPSGTMMAQTWNTKLGEAMGLSIGKESESMSGLKGWYGPGANIHRSPFGGRNGEYYSEDGVLSGKMCAATVLGAKEGGVYSYIKHFVANDTEMDREGLFTFMTEQALREIYLKPFEIAIKEGAGNGLMTAMNRLGRVWAGGNYGLMHDIVRVEWGFKGAAVTDWINKGETFMPLYRGIWAGNDIWLNNFNNSDMFSSSYGADPGRPKSNNDPVFITLAQNVAKDVLWTVIDTENAKLQFDPNASVADLSEGAVFNMTWVWYVVLVEVAFAAGAGVMGYFLVRNILRNRKKTESVGEGEAEGAYDGGETSAPDETADKE